MIQVGIGDGIGNSRWVTADLVDVIGTGCGLALMTLLRSGSTVAVRGNLGESRDDVLEARVRWCMGKTDGTFRAGLEFLSSSNFQAEREHFYEVMQLSPRADADTIARVYRMLAFRYHPDNAETGDQEMFLRLSEAHETLSNPEKRAAYDISLRAAKHPFRTEWEKRRTIEMVTAAYSEVHSLPHTNMQVYWEG